MGGWVGWKHMVPRCRKQALWKDQGRLFNHGIPEESQWDTHFVPLLLAHKCNCFTRTTRNLIQRQRTEAGEFMYVCLWITLCRSCGTVCVCVCAVLQMHSRDCYTLCICKQRAIHWGKVSVEIENHQYRCALFGLYYSTPSISYFYESLWMHKPLYLHLLFSRK